MCSRNACSIHNRRTAEGVALHEDDFRDSVLPCEPFGGEKTNRVLDDNGWVHVATQDRGRTVEEMSYRAQVAPLLIIVLIQPDVMTREQTLLERDAAISAAACE